jgi:hypothetical protein
MPINCHSPSLAAPPAAGKAAWRKDIAPGHAPILPFVYQDGRRLALTIAKAGVAAVV